MWIRCSRLSALSDEGDRMLRCPALILQYSAICKAGRYVNAGRICSALSKNSRLQTSYTQVPSAFLNGALQTEDDACYLVFTFERAVRALSLNANAMLTMSYLQGAIKVYRDVGNMILHCAHYRFPRSLRSSWPPSCGW